MTGHVTVLLKEAIDALDLAPGKVFLDGTLGGGGHSAVVAERFGDKVTIIGLDQDEAAVRRAEERLRTLTQKAKLEVASFSELDLVLAELGLSKVDAVLFDLGISSDQLETSGRGFTFQRDEPLDMRMSLAGTLTAKEILNTWEEDTLELILRGFGEEKFARRIAHKIIERRELKPFETTFDLLEVVAAASPASAKRFKIHPATRTFQALRIAVNGELSILEKGLAKGFDALAPQGHFAVISFHSLEDRIVKNFFKAEVGAKRAVALTKKPIVPSDEEVQLNPRSRSAKLRVVQKL